MISAFQRPGVRQFSELYPANVPRDFCPLTCLSSVLNNSRLGSCVYQVPSTGTLQEFNPEINQHGLCYLMAVLFQFR